MGFIDSIAKTLGGKRGAPATSTDLARALEAAVAERDRAAQAYSAHEQTRPDAVLTGEAGRQAFRDKLAQLAADADDASALAAVLERRLAEALAAEKQALRRAVYDTAKAKRDAAAKRLADEYPKAVAGLRDLLRLIAEADDAVEAANSALPESVPALAPVEATVRDIPGEADEILGEKVVRLWCVAGTFTPVPEAMQSEISDLGDGHGTRWFTDSAGKFRQSQSYDLRAFRRIERRRGRPGAVGPRLAGMSLPELKAGDAPYWVAPPFLPGPAAVLAALDGLAAEADRPPEKAENSIVYELAAEALPSSQPLA